MEELERSNLVNWCGALNFFFENMLNIDLINFCIFSQSVDFRRNLNSLRGFDKYVIIASCFALIDVCTFCIAVVSHIRIDARGGKTACDGDFGFCFIRRVYINTLIYLF